MPGLHHLDRVNSARITPVLLALYIICTGDLLFAVASTGFAQLSVISG